MENFQINKIKCIFYNKIEDKELELKHIKNLAKNIKCFYCLDINFIYTKRHFIFTWFNISGSYNILNCQYCQENNNWIKYSHDPNNEFPGICCRDGIYPKLDQIADDIIDKLMDGYFQKIHLSKSF